MSSDSVTITLPFSQQELGVIAFLLGLVALSLLVYGLLRLSERKLTDYQVPHWAFPLIAVVSALFIGALLSASAVLIDTIRNVWIPGKNAGPNLGAGALIAALLGAPFLIWGTVIKQTTLTFQKEGHITDRISKAVEQLGAEKTVKRLNDKRETVETSEPNIEVRIGGLLSLERIAQDSTRYDKGRDHVRVMEILCAYVRQNVPAYDLSPNSDLKKRPFPRLDFQVAVDVIKRRSDDQIEIEHSKKYRLDLRGTNFGGLNLSYGKFVGAIFFDCRFDFASLHSADCTGALFDRSVLNYVQFLKADLTGASMECCRYTLPVPHAGGWNTNLSLAKTQGLSFVGADLTAVDYLGDGQSKTFGCKDTVLGWELNEQRTKLFELKKSLRKLEKNGSLDELARVKDQIEESPFSAWSPYTKDDMANPHLLKELRTSLGQTSWPFSD